MHSTYAVARCPSVRPLHARIQTAKHITTRCSPPGRPPFLFFRAKRYSNIRTMTLPRNGASNAFGYEKNRDIRRNLALSLKGILHLSQ